MSDITKKTVKAAFISSLPIMAGYICLGIGFGVLLQSKGYNFCWAIFMAIFMYAGSMQYVAVDILSGGASLIAAALMTLMVNARHLFYGISMLENYKKTGKLKPLLAFTLTDETYSLVCSKNLMPAGIDENKYYLILSLLNQSYWIIGCTLGAVLGAAIPFNSTGIEFAMTSLFVMIFIEQWETADTHIPALIGIVSTLICLIVFGTTNFLIPSMIVITVSLLVLKKPIEKFANKAAAKKGKAADTTNETDAREAE